MIPTEDNSFPDPERLLGRGLRETTPEFEARFDAMCRRLSQTRPSIIDRVRDMLRAHPLTASVGAGAFVAAALIGIVVLWPSRMGRTAPTVPGTEWYADAAALDETLHGALVLTSPEMREVVALMPIESMGGGS